ncbi:MAG TPA: PAS domain-containing protein [Alphaproteobacteria bacterium]|nr:PAS domain-containing protein [Alphaproteobacteria bacterium]
MIDLVTVILGLSFFAAGIAVALLNKRSQEELAQKATAAFAALSASEASLKHAQQVGNMGSWDWNILTNDLAWSDQIYRIFGLAPQEFGASYPAFLECVHPDDRSRVEDAVRKALEGEAPYSIRHRIVLRDGSIRFVHEQGEVSRDTSGRPVHMVGTAQDVTEQVNLETSLRDMRRNLEDAQRLADIGSWEWNLARNEMVCSKQLYRIYGLEPKEGPTPLETFIERAHPEDRAFVDETVAQALRDKKPFAVDHRILRPDGTERTVHVQLQIECDQSGQIARTLGIARDVTDAKKIDNALRDNQEMLSGILSMAPEATIIADKDLKIMMFSRGATRTFGYEAAEIVGSHVSRLIPARFHEIHSGHVSRFAATGQGRRMNERGELWGLHKDGHEFPAEASLSMLKTAQGPVYTVILRDITDQKATRESLIAATHAAQAANEAKSRFIANMSHELRTPLNAIIGFSEVMNSEVYGPLGSEKYREYASDILKSGQHLLSLINDILSISRLEIGKAELKDEELNLPELVKRCLRWVSGHAFEGGVELLEEVEPNVPNLRADSRSLTQVLLNLLSNAVKFTPRGGKVTIAAKLMSDGGIELSVKDTGIGMTREKIERIGTPFLQFEDGLARRFEGAGLGLSIAKRLMELHGGTLTVSSIVGSGTTATIRLPPERSIWPASTPRNSSSMPATA